MTRIRNKDNWTLSALNCYDRGSDCTECEINTHYGFNKDTITERYIEDGTFKPCQMFKTVERLGRPSNKDRYEAWMASVLQAETISAKDFGAIFDIVDQLHHSGLAFEFKTPKNSYPALAEAYKKQIPQDDPRQAQLDRVIAFYGGKN